MKSVMVEKRKNSNKTSDVDAEKKRFRSESIGAETAALKSAVEEAKSSLPKSESTFNVNSITAMLRQAIRGGDNHLLHKALDVKDKRVIAKSVNELKASEASTLLQKIVDQIQDSPLLAQQRHMWIHMLLRHHAQVFASMPQIRPALETLAEHAQQRLSNQNALVRLLGRTEIVLFQAERRLEGAKATTAAVEDAKHPLVEFKQQLDDDEDDEEEETEGEEEEEELDGSDAEGEDDFEGAGDDDLEEDEDEDEDM